MSADIDRARRARSAAYERAARALRHLSEQAEAASFVGEEEDAVYFNDVTDVCDLFDLIPEEEGE